jgi:hypothetical protein
VPVSSNGDMAASTAMPLGALIPLLLIAAYFFIAAFVPGIRVRWGVGVGSSIIFSRRGAERSKYTHTKARMGAVTCLGLGTIFSSFAAAGLALHASFLPVLVVGFVLLGIGVVLDWLREPPKYTKR